MQLTHRWLTRCIDHLKTSQPLHGYEQNLFPIVQGNVYKDLRIESCNFITEKNAAGNAIGGLSVGEPEDIMYDITALCCEHLPFDKPRYLMGVGTPWNILECISLGVDMFDCVMPTRNGRNGMLFTTKGVINIKNKKWATDFSPIDEGLSCEISNYYSKAYLRHLFAADELLGFTLASIQNLTFYIWMMNEARNKILGGSFASWKTDAVKQFKQRL
jgi:queuine tRNA-ribosyltransferase